MTNTMSDPAIRNGVDTATLFATLDAVKGDNEIAAVQFRATNTWVSGTHHQSTIHGFYGAKQEVIYQRLFVFDADHPAVLIGTGNGPTRVRAARPRHRRPPGAYSPPDLPVTAAAADARMSGTRGAIDQHIDSNELRDEVLEPEPTWPVTAPCVEDVDLRAAGIGTIVWATGHRRSYPSLHIAALDEHGERRHGRDITRCPVGTCSVNASHTTAARTSSAGSAATPPSWATTSSTALGAARPHTSALSHC